MFCIFVVGRSFWLDHFEVVHMLSTPGLEGSDFYKSCNSSHGQAVIYYLTFMHFFLIQKNNKSVVFNRTFAEGLFHITCFPPQTVWCVDLRSLLVFVVFSWKIQEVRHHLRDHKHHKTITSPLIHHHKYMSVCVFCEPTSEWPMLAAAVNACCTAWPLLAALWPQQEPQLHSAFLNRWRITSMWPRWAAWTNTHRPELSTWPACSAEDDRGFKETGQTNF